ncbi:MAG: hypothetical protein J2P16_07760, partial [Mycobacterium sp.]|nr:hypothetical protein [Mycobacterium sp.]
MGRALSRTPPWAVCTSTGSS